MPEDQTLELDSLEIPIPDPAAGHLVIGQRTATSGMWTIGARLLTRLIDLVTMLVLARVLAPREFGVVAIAMTIISIVEAVFEMPVSSALVRLEVITGPHFDTAFTLSLMRGAALALLLGLLSLPYAHFYNDVRLIPLVCVLSLAPAARGLVSPRMAIYAKNFDFSREFTVEIASKVAAFAVALGIALSFKSYWAIALGTVIAPVTGAFVSYILAPYRPRLSLAELPAFSGFIGWFVGAQVLSALNWQSDRLILAKLTSLTELGFFSTANDVSMIPLNTLTGPIIRPLLSAFSFVRHDMKRLAASYQTSASAMVTLGLPILLGESVLAEPAIRLILGPKWMGAVPMLRWLAISIIPSLFAMPMGPLAMSLSRTEVFARRNAFEMCIKLPLVVFGAFKYGFMGVIAARMVSEVATVVFCMLIVRKLAFLSIKRQLLSPWRGLVSGFVMVMVLYFVAPLLTRSTMPIPLALGTAASVLLGAGLYLATLMTLWNLAGRPNGIEALAVNRIRLMARS